MLAEAAFPDRDWWACAFLGMALLVLALRRDSARWAAVVGLAFGLSFFLPHLVWAREAVGAVPWVILSAGESAFMALAAAAWVWARRAGVVQPHATVQVLTFALIWVAVEELRSSWPFGGFPWGRLAFSQVEGPLSRLAWLGGTPLLSAVVAAIGVLLALALLALLRLRIGAASGAVLTAAALVLSALLIPLDTQAESGRLLLGAVQGNVPTPGLDAFAQQRQVLDDHRTGTLALLEQVEPGELDVVLWPENSADVDPQVDAAAAQVVEDAARAVDAPVLVGTIEYPPDGGRLNTALLWEPGTGAVDAYRKQRPAPFAEYIPLRDLARLFSAEVDRVRTDMLPGVGPGVVTVDARQLGREVDLGVAICFEVAYDGLVRSAVLAGGEMLVIPTNNASFGYTDEAVQQLAMSRLRAIEHGRATVQISTVGVSAVIAPNGVVLDRTGLFTAEQMVRSVPLRTSLTPAARLGPWVAWSTQGAAGLLVALGLVGAVRSRSTGREPHRHREHAPRTRHDRELVRG